MMSGDPPSQSYTEQVGSFLDNKIGSSASSVSKDNDFAVTPLEQKARIDLDQVQPQKASISLNHHAEYRKNFRARLSGDLAKGLWYLLGLTVILNLLTVIALSWRLTNPPKTGDIDRSERIEKAVAIVDSFAKTLYAVLTPLATAVTGYYFSTGADSDSDQNSEQEKIHDDFHR
jgi:hypothetical protein